MKKPLIIDDQFHIIPPNYLEALSKRGIGNVGGIPMPEWNPEKAIELMDQRGIDMAIGCLSEPGVYFNGDLEWARELAQMYNEYCADLVKKYPDRFRCMGTLPLPSVEYSVEEIDYIFDELKLSAVVLLSNIQGEYLGNPKFEPIFEALNRHKATVFIHPTLPAQNSRSSAIDVPPWVLDFIFDTTRAAADLWAHGILEKYPDIKFVLSHLGGTLPYAAQRIECMWQDTKNKGLRPELHEMNPKGALYYFQKMYFSSELTSDPAIYDLLVRFAGHDHILSGSDYPFAAPYWVDNNLKHLHAYFGNNREILADVLGRNAARVYMNMPEV